MPTKVYVLIPPPDTGAMPVVYGSEELLQRAVREQFGVCNFVRLPVVTPEEVFSLDTDLQVYAIKDAPRRVQVATALVTYVVE